MPLLLWADWVDTSGSGRLKAQKQQPARLPPRPMDDEDVLLFAWVMYLRHYYRLEEDGQGTVAEFDKQGR